MKKKITILSTLVALVISGFAVEMDSTKTKGQLFPNYQVSFIYPMGTNGYESKDMKVMYSLNLIGGVVGGVDGLELGGLFNAVNGKMNGLQASGFVNAVKDSVTGVQLSGYVNANNSFTKGAQFAGFTNVNGGNFAGIQGSGFLNYNHKSTDGIQLAGFSNITFDTLRGVQSAGFCNYTKYTKSYSSQLAGFCNIALDTIKGIQAAGFGNFTKGSLKGAQLAGFGNFSSGEVDGIQAAGFINLASKVKGTQIGFLNMADSVDGVSIGFLSIIKNGYNYIEIEGNESFYSSLNLKLGTEKFYNILSIGAKPTKGNLTWGWGYGAGTNIKLGEKTAVSFDFSAHHINENEWFTKELNLLTKFSPALSYSFAKHLSIYVGPSLNVLIQNDNISTQNILPWNSYQWDDNHTNIYIYPGLRGGFRF